MDKLGIPQDILCPRRRLPCKRCRLRRHWRRLVLAYTPGRLCGDARWQELELIHFALVSWIFVACGSKASRFNY